MSHASNPQFLPPPKSPAEYEREIEKLESEVSAAWTSAYSIGYADKSCGQKHGYTPNPHECSS